MANDHTTMRIEALSKQLTGELSKRLAHRTLLGAEPKPWEQAAADFWGIQEREEQDFTPGIKLRVRKVQPFVVLRKTFEVAPASVVDGNDPWPDTGCRAIADAAAAAEVRAIFYQQATEGLEPNLGGIDGILGNPVSGHPDNHASQPVGESVGDPVDVHLRAAVEKAVQTIGNAGIDGPFAVLLPTDGEWSPPTAATDVKAITDIAAKGIHRLPGLDHGCVVSTASGNYEFHYGGGWRVRHLRSAPQHEFVVEEALAFRVVERKAAVRLVKLSS